MKDETRLHARSPKGPESPHGSPTIFRNCNAKIESFSVRAKEKNKTERGENVQCVILKKTL